MGNSKDIDASVPSKTPWLDLIGQHFNDSRVSIMACTTAASLLMSLLVEYGDAISQPQYQEWVDHMKQKFKNQPDQKD